MTGDPRVSGQLGHMRCFFAKCRRNFPSAFCCPTPGKPQWHWLYRSSMVPQADLEAAGRGPAEGGGTEEATAILGMALSAGAQPCHASLWTAYKAWCNFCLWGLLLISSCSTFPTTQLNVRYHCIVNIFFRFTFIAQI